MYTLEVGVGEEALSGPSGGSGRSGEHRRSPGASGRRLFGGASPRTSGEDTLFNAAP